MDNANKVQAVIFDWAGVFCSPGEPFSHRRLKELTGLSLEELGKETQSLQDEYYRGKISTHEFWGKIIEKFNLPLTKEELSAAYLSSYSIYPEMLEIAAKVKRRVKTALLSNLTSEMMEEIIRMHSAPQYFDFVFFSNEIGYIKPEPESFEIALKSLGVPAENTLFIDDSERNVLAAKKMGFQTITFETIDQFRNEFNSLADFEV